ncbi:MAG: ribonuclease HI family protein [bacterium]
MDNVEIYIDGSSQGNPGHSGIGLVLIDNNNREIGIYSEYIGEKTSNQAEYIALLYAVEIMRALNVKSAVIYTDSKLIKKQINGEYRVKNDKMRALIKEYFKMREGLNIDVVLLGRDNNIRADKIAKDASFGVIRNTLNVKISKIIWREGD